jgi:hypothetical protein
MPWQRDLMDSPSRKIEWLQPSSDGHLALDASARRLDDHVVAILQPFFGRQLEFF